MVQRRSPPVRTARSTAIRSEVSRYTLHAARVLCWKTCLAELCQKRSLHDVLKSNEERGSRVESSSRVFDRKNRASETGRIKMVCVWFTLFLRSQQTALFQLNSKFSWQTGARPFSSFPSQSVLFLVTDPDNYGFSWRHIFRAQTTSLIVFFSQALLFQITLMARSCRRHTVMRSALTNGFSPKTHIFDDSVLFIQSFVFVQSFGGKTLSNLYIWS